MTTTIPIFPLNTVLYPEGMLQLKIFEQRYLDMTKACLRDASGFGVCRIAEGSEVGLPAVPVSVGCTASIEEWEMPHLGVFHLNTRGRQPFRIVGQMEQRNGLIQAEIEFLEDLHGELNVDAFAFCRRVLEQVVNRIGTEYFFPPAEYENPRWVSYRLAEVLPLEASEKQALLETRADAERIARLYALLKQVV
jgi:Lon protease-like protein